MKFGMDLCCFLAISLIPLKCIVEGGGWARPIPPVRKDKRCGPKYPISNGAPADCLDCCDIEKGRCLNDKPCDCNECIKFEDGNPDMNHTWKAWNPLTDDADEWIMIQHKKFGKDADRQFGDASWQDYVNGFGTDASSYYWLGLETMHQLTNAQRKGRWDVLVSIRFKRFHGRGFNYVIFKDFKVDSEVFEYTLHVGDAHTDITRRRFPLIINYRADPVYYLLPQYDGIPFTAGYGLCDDCKDFKNSGRDNDRNEKNCGFESSGGWWFDTSCSLKNASNNNFCPNCRHVFGIFSDHEIIETYMGMRFIKIDNLLK